MRSWFGCGPDGLLCMRSCVWCMVCHVSFFSLFNCTLVVFFFVSLAAGCSLREGRPHQLISLSLDCPVHAKSCATNPHGVPIVLHYCSSASWAELLVGEPAGLLSRSCSHACSEMLKKCCSPRSMQAWCLADDGCSSVDCEGGARWPFLAKGRPEGALANPGAPHNRAASADMRTTPCYDCMKWEKKMCRTAAPRRATKQVRLTYQKNMQRNRRT